MKTLKTEFQMKIKTKVSLNLHKLKTKLTQKIKFSFVNKLKA